MTTLDEIRARFTDQLQQVDDVAQVILKGHLVIEELMTEAIKTFLLHGEFVEQSRLQFHQKLQLCRAMSISDHKNEMWALIASINSLRNQLSHSLDPDDRHKRVEALSATFSQQFPEGVPEGLAEMPKDTAVCMLAIAGSIGYLHAHVEEIHRFKGMVIDMDKALNGGKLSEA